MNKVVAGIVTLGAALLASSAAFAQEGSLPAEGNFVFGAERMFGFHSYKGTIDVTVQGTKATATQSGTQLSLLWGANSIGGDGLGANPDAIPRVAFDYMISDLISLGGSLGYYSTSGEQKTEAAGQSASEDTPDMNGFAFAPRIGFMIPLTETVGLWPRAGFTYYKYNVSYQTGNGDAEQNATLEQVNLEGMFFLSPVDHFGFLVGPVIDIGVGGSIEQKAGGASESYDAKWTNFGLAAGLGGYL